VGALTLETVFQTPALGEEYQVIINQGIDIHI
jgi:hypothetical protein